MQLDFSHLEVVFTNHKDGIKAVCPMFPGCRGVGETEEDALVKLTQSVSRMMAKLTRSSLESVLLSDQYTDVISGPAQSTGEKKRLFSLNQQINLPRTPDGKPQTLFMIKSLHELPGLAKTKEAPSIHDTGFQPLEMEADHVEDASGFLTQSGGVDEISFGFPISLN